MKELVQRVSRVAGVDDQTAERAIEIIFELVRDHGPADKVKELFDKLPDLGNLQVDDDKAGGLLGGLGGFGGAMGAMGALNKLTEAGLSMDEIQTVAREVLQFTREHAGEQLVNEVVGAIPGVNQFV